MKDKRTFILYDTINGLSVVCTLRGRWMAHMNITYVFSMDSTPPSIVFLCSVFSSIVKIFVHSSELWSKNSTVFKKSFPLKPPTAQSLSLEIATDTLARQNVIVGPNDHLSSVKVKINTIKKQVRFWKRA